LHASDIEKMTLAPPGGKLPLVSIGEEGAVMRKTMLFVGILSALAGLANAALAADLPEIKKRGKLLAATSGNLLPVSYVNEKNELVGYDIDVAHYIEKKIGVPFDIARLDFKGIMPGLQTGRFDAVFSNVNITEERKKIFDYSIPYSRSAIVAVVRTGVTGVKGYKDLKGKNVGGISGGADGELPAREIEKQFGAFKSFKGYPGNTELFSDLAAGRLDVAISPDTAAAAFLKTHAGVAKITGEPFVVRYVGVPMQKGSKELKAAFDQAIRDMKKEGLLDKWGKQYFGIDAYSAQLVDRDP
jgi:cystine transport system substrate-binding protein